MHRKKFRFNPILIEQILSEIESRSVFIQEEHFAETFTDLKDVIFYEVTMTARKEKNAYLVTGNLRHFPDRNFIVSPRQMLEIMMQ